MSSMRTLAIMAMLAAAMDPLAGHAAPDYSARERAKPPAPRDTPMPVAVDNGKSWGRPKKSKRNRKSRGA